MIDFMCQHWGSMVVLIPVALIILYYAWLDYREAKFNSMWDGKPWDEAEYQRRKKVWDEELKEKLAKEQELEKEQDSR